MLKIFLLRYAFVYSLANTHQDSITLIFIVVGKLPVFLEQTNRKLIIPKQEMALSLRKDQVIIVLNVRTMAES